uniref:Uncharacterized protein n=1 Tax=Arundo donax TaxID=35708 RepID=A0A0A9HJG0_ARUDO
MRGSGGRICGGGRGR